MRDTVRDFEVDDIHTFQCNSSFTKKYKSAPLQIIAKSHRGEFTAGIVVAASTANELKHSPRRFSEHMAPQRA